MHFCFFFSVFLGFIYVLRFAVFYSSFVFIIFTFVLDFLCLGDFFFHLAVFLLFLLFDFLLFEFLLFEDFLDLGNFGVFGDFPIFPGFLRRA
jgi:hypothetical protein